MANTITGKVPAHGTKVPGQGKKVPTTGTNDKTIEINTKYILKIEKNKFHSKKPLPTKKKENEHKQELFPK